jgi:hypothetical protein
MSVDVKIELKGLALCFLDNVGSGDGPVWNVAFLCDANHVLELKINGRVQPDWRPADRDITLYVQHVGGYGEQCSGENRFRRLLNISGNYAHGASAANSHKSNLNIQRRKQDTVLVWMQVPHSEFDVDEYEHTKIVRTHPDHGVPKKLRNRAKEVELTFEVDQRIILVPRLYQPPPSTPPLPDPPQISIDPVDNEITLEFNNRCDPNNPLCNRNDFVDLYEFVVHTNAQGREVRYISWAEDAETEILLRDDGRGGEMEEEHLKKLKEEGWEKISDGDESSGEVEIRKKHFSDLVDRRRSTVYGNCDPVGSEPPPGP